MKYRSSYLMGIILLVTASIAHAEAVAVFTASGGEVEIKNGAIGGSDNAIKVGSGFKVNDSSGIEIYWATYGEPEKTVNFAGLGNREVSTQIFNLAFQYVHYFPVGGSFDILARFGLAFWKSEVDIAGSGRYRDDGIDLIAGIGAEMPLSDAWGVRLEWEYSELHNFDVSLLSVGISHYFE